MLADVEGINIPVVVKRLRGANPDIYCLLCNFRNFHVPQVYALEQQENELVVAEEYIDGENLEEYLKKQKQRDVEKLNLAIQLCEAVVPSNVNGSKFQERDASLFLDMMGIAAVMHNDKRCKFTGVTFLKDGTLETEVDSEWYSIACGGRYIFLDRKFILQNCENDRLTVYYQFDDRSCQKVNVEIMYKTRF